MQQIVDFVLSDLIMVITPIVFGKLTLDKNLRKDKSKLVVAFLISCILYGLSYLYLDGEIKTLCVFILHIFMFYNFFNIKFFKSCIVSFIYCSIVMICDFLFLLIVTLLFNVAKELCYTTIAGSLISNIIVCLLSLILSFLCRKKIIYLFATKVEEKFLIIIIFMGFISVLKLFYEMSFNYKFDYNYIFPLFVLFVFLIIILNLFNNKIMLNRKSGEYDTLLKFMKNYENELEEKRIKGHEVKNQISTINSMLKDNANKYKLEKYVKGLVGDYADLDDVKYSDLQYLPSNGIKGFICSKISLAISKEINVELIIQKEIENSILNNLNDKDFKYLCIILGVLLDNAIEASLESINKKMGIEIYLLGEDVLIIITNSFESNRIDKNDILKSRKGPERGNGLKLVRRVISHSDNFKLTTEVSLDSFIQKLIIKKY